jgi:hypothetical protein
MLNGIISMNYLEVVYAKATGMEFEALIKTYGQILLIILEKL